MTQNRQQRLGQGRGGRANPRADARTRRAGDSQAGGLQYGSEFFIGTDGLLHLRVAGAIRVDRTEGVVLDVQEPLQVSSPLRLDLDFPFVVQKDGSVGIDERALEPRTTVEVADGLEIESDEIRQRRIAAARQRAGRMESVVRTLRDRVVRLRVRTDSTIAATNGTLGVNPAASVETIKTGEATTVFELVQKMNELLAALEAAGLMQSEA